MAARINISPAPSGLRLRATVADFKGARIDRVQLVNGPPRAEKKGRERAATPTRDKRRGQVQGGGFWPGWNATPRKRIHVPAERRLCGHPQVSVPISTDRDGEKKRSQPGGRGGRAEGVRDARRGSRLPPQGFYTREYRHGRRMTSE